MVALLPAVNVPRKQLDDYALLWAELCMSSGVDEEAAAADEMWRLFGVIVEHLATAFPPSRDLQRFLIDLTTLVSTYIGDHAHPLFEREEGVTTPNKDQLRSTLQKVRRSLSVQSSPCPLAVPQWHPTMTWHVEASSYFFGRRSLA
jgi:hypothetical protein